MTPHTRRKALAAAYGAHVVLWNKAVYRRLAAAARVRDAELAAWYREEWRKSEESNALWAEAIDELRDRLVKWHF